MFVFKLRTKIKNSPQSQVHSLNSVSPQIRNFFVSPQLRIRPALEIDLPSNTETCVQTMAT